MRRALLLTACSLAGVMAVSAVGAANWQTLSAEDAKRIVESAMARGRVSGGRRLLNTERARSYKVVAVWLSADVSAASARLLQFRERLSEPAAADALRRAERDGDTVFMIDIDPDEGSGVVPRDWAAYLQPLRSSDRAVAGTQADHLRDIPVFARAIDRNYDYDRFWVTFPMRAPDGRQLFTNMDIDAELIIRIRDREGRLKFRIPETMRSQ